MGPATLRAEPSKESLAHQEPNRARKQGAWHPQVRHPGESPEGAGGMDGSEDEVTGERQTDGKFRRFRIPDLPEDDHIRVVPQEGL